MGAGTESGAVLARRFAEVTAEGAVEVGGVTEAELFGDLAMIA